MSQETVKDKLLGLEERYWQAIKDGNGAQAARLSDDPCLLAGAQGLAQLDRETLARMTEDARYQLEAFALSDFDVRLVTPDVAVVAYKVNERLTVEGETVELAANDSSTWVRRAGEWFCAAHTESLAGDPFGRDRRRAA